MQIYNIKSIINKQTFVNPISVTLNSADCINISETSYVNLISTSYNDITLFFNLNNNLNHINYYSEIFTRNVSKTHEIIKINVIGEMVNIPIYNKAYNRYLNINLSSEIGKFTGVISNDDQYLIYIVNADIGNLNSGIKYRIDKNAKTTTIIFDRYYFSDLTRFLLMRDISIRVSFIDKKQLYIYRGDDVDINNNFHLLYTSQNTEELWEQ